MAWDRHKYVSELLRLFLDWKKFIIDLFVLYSQCLENLIFSMLACHATNISLLSANGFSQINRGRHSHDIMVVKSPKRCLETYCFCSVSYYYYSPFFHCDMNVSTADLRNYWTEFNETWWSYRYMFLVGPKVFSFVVKGVKVIYWGVQRVGGLLYNLMGNLKFRTLILITSKWIMIET